MGSSVKELQLYQAACAECGVERLDDGQIIKIVDYIAHKKLHGELTLDMENLAQDVQLFRYRQRELRVYDIEGVPWWVLADVCKVLGIAAPSRAAARLDPDEKGVRQTHTLGGPQKMTVINESGLYSVILRSDKPEAKPFKRWVTHEVLPAIRRTGSYGLDLPAERTRWEAEAAQAQMRLKAECFDIIRALLPPQENT